VWKDTEDADRPQMTMWSMRIACWIAKATNTPAEYVIIIGFSTSAMVTRTRLNLIPYGHITSRRARASVRRKSVKFIMRDG